MPPSIVNVYNSIVVMGSLLWPCKRSSYGELNADKTFLLIDAEYTGGLNDLVSHCCAFTAIARRRGWIPVVKMDSPKVQYSYNGENMWESYFEPVSEFSVEEVLKSANVISLRDNHIEYYEHFINLYQEHELFAQYTGDEFRKTVRINKTAFSYVNNKIPKEIISDDCRVLGVVMRGTDYRETSALMRLCYGHNTSLDRMINRAEVLCSVWQYDYIFVATEEAGYLEAFRERFHDKLIYVNQRRVEYVEERDKNKSVAELLQSKSDNTFGLDYLSVIYALSKCDGMLSSSWCGAYIMARRLKDSEYEVDEVL